jgi:hypothetical protein
MKSLLGHNGTTIITRLLAAIVGCVFLLLGIGMLIFPELLASTLFAVTVRPVGTSSLRAVFGTLFLGMAGFCLVGAISRYRWLLLVPSIFLLQAIVTHLISTLVDDFPGVSSGILGAEVVFLVSLVLALLSHSLSSKKQTTPPVAKLLLAGRYSFRSVFWSSSWPAR